MNKILNYRKYEKDTEIDWHNDLDVLGLNLSTMQFENVSYITKGATLKLNIYHNSADYSEEIADEARKVNADFILYTFDGHWVVGYVKL